MPEMAKYCGRSFQVTKSAHKTCDPTGCTDLRRMNDAGADLFQEFIGFVDVGALAGAKAVVVQPDRALPC